MKHREAPRQIVPKEDNTVEAFQWIMAGLAVGGMLLSAGALGYAAREASRLAERNRERLEHHDRRITELSGTTIGLREMMSEVRSDLRRIEGLIRGENGRRP